MKKKKAVSRKTRKKPSPRKRTRKKGPVRKKKTGKSIRAKKKTGPVGRPKPKLGNRVAGVTHYFPHVNAAIVKVTKGVIRVGDALHFKGHTTDFKCQVSSMQIDHAPIQAARVGDEAGIEVRERVREGDSVYKVKA